MKNKKVIILFLSLVIIGLIVLAIILYNNSKSSYNKKVECKSEYARVTLYFDDDSITSYTSDGDFVLLDTANAFVKEMGVDNYIEEFISRFEKRYGGTCEIK